MKLNNKDEQMVFNKVMSATIPVATNTYTPVPHSDFLQMLRDKLADNGFLVKNRRLLTNGNGQKLVGFYNVRETFVETDPNFGLDMSIGFKNSYDKSMAVGLALGGSVIVCDNGVVSGDLITFKRKHTGTVLEELREKINEAVLLLKASYHTLALEVDIMRDYELTSKQKAEILGVMYFENDIITPNQLSIVKNELNNSQHFKGNTLWDLYNNVTQALKESHPSRHIEDHIKLHSFMTDIAGTKRVLEEAMIETEETIEDGTPVASE